MLVKLWRDGYIDLRYTSNLGAKYAFAVPDETLISAFGDMNADQLIYLRGQLAIARFFPNQPELSNFIGNVFTSRVQNGAAIGDVADVY